MKTIQVLLASSVCLCLVRGFDDQAELHLASSDASCNSKLVSEGPTGKEHKQAVISPPSISSQGDDESEEAEGVQVQLVQMSTALKKVQMQHHAVEEAAAGQKAEAEEKAESHGVQAEIPHILHQSWKTLEVPAQLSALAKSWKDAHPAWMHMVWTDKGNLRLWNNESAELFNLYNSFTEPVMGADATRLLYMKNFGGVYADFDVEPCLNLDEVLSKYQLIFVRSPVGFVSNYFYASAAGHPFWDFALQQLPKLRGRMAIGRQQLIEKGQVWTVNDEIMWTAGPRFIDRAISMYAEEYGPKALDRVKIYDFYEWHAKVAIHHWMGSWHCPGGATECTEEEKFSEVVTDGVEKGVDPSKACIAVVGFSSNTSSVPDNTPLSQAQTDVCFVHVGKTGGNSIVRALNKLREGGWIGDLLQVHHYYDTEPDHNGEFAWLPGPLQQHSLSLYRCAKTDNVVLWLRDPVSRFISAWNFLVENSFLPEQPEHPDQVAAVRTFLVDHSLNTTELAEGPASLRQVDLDPLLIKLFSKGITVQIQFFNLVPHGSDPAFWYLDSCSDLSSIPISFVGTQESMDEDWRTYVKDVLGAPPHDLDIVHSTDTRHESRVLSDSAVSALREYYATEFTCIAKLIEAHLLSPSYLDAVTSKSKSYRY